MNIAEKSIVKGMRVWLRRGCSGPGVNELPIAVKKVPRASRKAMQK